jgi:acetyltransferase EpsM
MRIMLWGGRSKARIVLAMIGEIYKEKAELVGIFDKSLSALPFETSIPLCSEKSELEYLCKSATHFVICIGGEHGYARFNTAQKLKEKGIQPLNLISRHGLLDELDYCGEGVQVMPGAIVHKFSSVGRQCILNTNSTVDHECKLGDGVHVMGGASIAGRVKVGDFSTIGTNATILPNLNIGANVFIGAGAVVTRDIEDNSVVAGVPARFVKKITPIFDASIFDT